MSLRDKIKRQEQANGNSPTSPVQPDSGTDKLLKDIYTLTKELGAKIAEYEQERSKNNGKHI